MTNTMTDQEALTYINNNLPPFDQRNCIRYSKPFKDFTITWCRGNFNAKKKVGSLMSTISTLPEDATREDWTKLFLEKNLGPAGILEEVGRLATFGRIAYNTALTYWWIHLQDSVYSGWQDEVTVGKMLKEYANSKGLEVRHATDWEDRNYCVDFVVYNPTDKTVISGVQVKGEAALKSKRENAVRARTILDPPKYAAFTKKYGVEVVYLLIEPTIKTGKLAWHTTKCYN